MSIPNLSRGAGDFRAASGLASWSPAILDQATEDGPAPRGPGLFEVGRANGERLITNVRRIAGAERAPGSAVVSAATSCWACWPAGLFVVTLSAQYKYVFAAKHQAIPAMIEAAALDLGMAIFALLALGLAMAGQAAKIERALIVACALGSAAQNYAAADVTSPRSVAAYVAPPLFLALVVDRVVAVVRRHVLGDDERSVWAAVGRALAAVRQGPRPGLAYVLRLVLAPPSTSAGLRRMVLIATPLPAAEKPEDQSGRTAMRTKTTGQGTAGAGGRQQARPAGLVVRAGSGLRGPGHGRRGGEAPGSARRPRRGDRPGVHRADPHRPAEGR